MDNLYQNALKQFSKATELENGNFSSLNTKKIDK